MASSRQHAPKRNATPPSRQQSPNWQQKQQAQSISSEMEEALQDGMDVILCGWLSSCCALSLMSETSLSSPNSNCIPLVFGFTVEFKFIMNLPESELQTSERLFFQIEQVFCLSLDKFSNQVVLYRQLTFIFLSIPGALVLLRLFGGCTQLATAAAKLAQICAQALRVQRASAAPSLNVS